LSVLCLGKVQLMGKIPHTAAEHALTAHVRTPYGLRKSDGAQHRDQQSRRENLKIIRLHTFLHRPLRSLKPGQCLNY
jgi:hypothetical protein